jgi:colicin import membrane protein
MKPGMTISFVGHAVALGFAVVAISASPMESPPMDTITAQIVSDKDVSQMTKGVKNAPQLKIPDLKPLADKVDQEKSVDQLAPKAADKPAVTTDASKADAPKPDQPKPDAKAAAKSDPKPPDPKPPDPKADPKPDQKQADKPKTPDYKPDQIANILKKDAAKEAKNDNSAQQKPNSPKFDANQVAQLLDQRAPQRQLAAASQLNDVATLGTATAPQAADLAQSEFDAFIARLRNDCWNPPPGLDNAPRIVVTIRVLMKRDGSLAAQPVVTGGPASPLGPAVAQTAMHALLQCQPFKMFKPEHYDQWKDLSIDFDSKSMAGG